MRAKLHHPKLQTRPIIYYFSEENFTNSALNLALFLYLEAGYTPEQAIAPFANIIPCPLERYRDATWCAPTYFLDIVSCISGLQKALTSRFFGGGASRFVDDFNCDVYEECDNPFMLNLHQVRVLSPSLIELSVAHCRKNFFLR